MESLWKKALKIGECPYKGCDLTQKTCSHLDKYLEMGRAPGDGKRSGFMGKGVEIEYLHTSDIDDFAFYSHIREVGEIEGAWDLFKRLRKFPLRNDQVHLLVLRFAYGFDVRDIVERMHWSHMSSYYNRFRSAMRIIEKGAR